MRTPLTNRPAVVRFRILMEFSPRARYDRREALVTNEDFDRRGSEDVLRTKAIGIQSYRAHLHKTLDRSLWYAPSPIGQSLRRSIASRARCLKVGKAGRESLAQALGGPATDSTGERLRVQSAARRRGENVISFPTNRSRRSPVEIDRLWNRIFELESGVARRRSNFFPLEPSNSSDRLYPSSMVIRS